MPLLHQTGGEMIQGRHVAVLTRPGGYRGPRAGRAPCRACACERRGLGSRLRARAQPWLTKGLVLPGARPALLLAGALLSLNVAATGTFLFEKTSNFNPIICIIVRLLSPFHLVVSKLTERKKPFLKCASLFPSQTL